MTRYEQLLARINQTSLAYVLAQCPTMKAVWLRNLAIMRDRLDDMPVSIAVEIV